MYERATSEQVRLGLGGALGHQDNPTPFNGHSRVYFIPVG